MRFGIRYQLLVPLGLLMLGVIGAGLWSARVAANRARDRVASQIHNVSGTLTNANFPLTVTVLEQMKSLSGADFVLINNADRSTATFPTDSKILKTLLEVPESDRDEIGSKIELPSGSYLCHRLELKEPNPSAHGEVFILYPESLLQEAIADAERPAFVGLVLSVVALLLMMGIGQRLIERIRVVDQRTRQIAHGDFSPMPVPRQDDEFRDLILSVNEMAQKLDDLSNAVRTAERSRLTGQLAAGLAHQLRNSVTGAKLAIQLHVDELAEPSEALDVALRQMALMESNLRRFIDLGRPSVGSRRACSLTNILQDVVDLLRPRAQHARIRLTFDHDETDCQIVGDAQQLHDLFMNLITNGLDAAGPGGEVGLRLSAQSERFEIEVSDSGNGPPNEIVARLFEPFVTGKSEGIGLGLAVARSAAEFHGGSITWSRRQERTVFRVELLKSLG